MKRCSAMAVALLMLPNFADALPGKIRGWGAASCGFWTKTHVPANPPTGESLAGYQLNQWVFGFVVGLAGVIPRPDPTVGIDNEGLIAWMDNYCRAHPTETINDAALTLMNELLRTQEQVAK